MKNNKTIRVLLLMLFFCTSLNVFSQGTFKDRKYTKSKVRIWVEDHLGSGKRARTTQENLNRAMQQLEITRKKIEEKNHETTPTYPANKTINEKPDIGNWTNDMLEEVNRITDEITKLINEASDLNPFKPKDKKRLTEIELTLTNLITKKIQPFQKIEMQIENSKILASDYSFKTGKSTLNNNAIDDIKTFPNDWEKEVLLWKNYKDIDGNLLYKNDEIHIRINIIGYADKQGSSNPEIRTESNRVLSEKRAQNVKKEIQESVQYLIKKYTLDIEFTTVGRGEELPPNTSNSELIDNPERRKVVVTAVIYPNSLVKKKIE